MIVGEVVSGSGTSFELANTPITGSVAVYAGGIRVSAGSDYTIDSAAITFLNQPGYSAGTVLADYLTTTSSGGSVGSDIISPFALTTLQRVKDLLFDPNLTFSLTGATLTDDSTTVTGITVQAGKTLRVGQSISGNGIPSGTTVSVIVSSSQITLSQDATANLTGQTLTVIDQPTAFDNVLARYINWATNYINNECGRPGGFVQQTYVNDTYSTSNPNQKFLLLRNTPVFWITSFQWRPGTPTNPNWTDFIPDQYELVDPRTDPVSGITWYPSAKIRIYGVLPRIYNNMIRCSYVAGYPVNWSNAEDHNTHWLPGDLTNVCENLVVRRFKRRQLAGQSSQSLEGANTSWRNEIDAEDIDVLNQYKDVHF